MYVTILLLIKKQFHYTGNTIDSIPKKEVLLSNFACLLVELTALDNINRP